MKYAILLFLLAISGATVWTYLSGTSPRLTFGDPGRDFQMPLGDFTVAQFSPDGKHILASCKQTRGFGKLWDVSTGKEIRAYPVPMIDFRSGIRAVAFSPDGKRVYAAAPTLMAWDNESGVSLYTAKASGWAMAVSPDGSKIVVGTAGGISVIDAKDGKVIKATFDGPEFLNEPPYKIHISPDGKWFVYHTMSEITIWDFAKLEMIILGHANPRGRDPKKQFQLPDKHSPFGIAISPNGKGILIPTAGGVIVEVDFATGKENKRYQLQGDGLRIGVMAVSPKGDKIMTSDLNNGDTRIYSFPDCRERKRIFGYGNVQFSPDGKTALTFTKDGRLMLWDVD